MENTALNQIISQLKELGLTTHEALTYTTLLTHPNITASALCNQTKIPDSKIYYALDSLSKKGMISSTTEHPLNLSPHRTRRSYHKPQTATKRRVRREDEAGRCHHKQIDAHL